LRRTLQRSGILLNVLEVSLQIFEELYWKFFKDTKATKEHEQLSFAFSNLRVLCYQMFALNKKPSDFFIPL